MLEPEEMLETNDLLEEKQRLDQCINYDEDDEISRLGELQPLPGDEDFNTDNISDGYHTFGELYHHRAILFAVVVKFNKGLAFKSKKHEDGTMFPGMFIVGVKTPKGWYSYHYDLKYWDMFKCKEWERAPKYDGHLPEDVDRLLSLNVPCDRGFAAQASLNSALNSALPAARNPEPVAYSTMQFVTPEAHAAKHSSNVEVSVKKLAGELEKAMRNSLRGSN